MLARRVALSLILVIAAISACKRKPTIPPDVIARVNDRMVTLADFKRYLERNAGSELAQLTPEVASALADQFVEEIIVSEYAASHGVEVPAEKIAAAVRTEAGVTVIEKRDEMRRERLIANLSGQIPDPAAATVQAYYDQHQAEFRSGEEVRVRQILVNDEELANEIVKKLKSGTPFGDLSAQYSRAPNAKRGGEIGFVSRGDLPKMFEEEIFRLRAGQVSDVLRTDTSFHIFQVDERRPAGVLDVQAATPIILTRLREDAVRERLSQIVARSRREMNIAILTRRLPFRYSGTLPKSEDE
ncbi:MAG TPA: peptidyl-prolyl cis-trans isomerase [Thermoanaerobaculia bacterium]|nr:peptidyl-prolyl cis-trans isomerase [Thermoanaerobaculia bacterium]